MFRTRVLYTDVIFNRCLKWSLFAALFIRKSEGWEEVFVKVTQSGCLSKMPNSGLIKRTPKLGLHRLI